MHLRNLRKFALDFVFYSWNTTAGKRNGQLKPMMEHFGAWHKMAESRQLQKRYQTTICSKYVGYLTEGRESGGPMGNT